MPRKAICLLLVPILLATACSRLTFVRPKGKMGQLSGQEEVADYSVKDSPEVRRRQGVQTILARSLQRLQAGEFALAEKEARSALKLDPTSVDALTMLAVIEGSQASRQGRRVLSACRRAGTRRWRDPEQLRHVVVRERICRRIAGLVRPRDPGAGLRHSGSCHG